ncbi:hypothetical protein [Spongiimicrobium salis]|uniref:hypothetical protein n=1 Tax=Spongiimicrobium salis TaxID=1667022 RepID=UPI00374D4E07
MKATSGQKQYIYKLCGYNQDLKEELVQWATEDVGKTSCDDLTFEEANQIIVNRGGNPHQASNWGAFDRTDQQHKQILSLCMQYGWQKKHLKTGRNIADIGKLGQWLEGTLGQGQGPVKKPLISMDTQEVSKTISALKAMVKKKYR